MSLARHSKILAACVDVPDTVRSAANRVTRCLVIIPVGMAANLLHKTPTGFWLRARTIVSMSASMNEPGVNIPDMASPAGQVYLMQLRAERMTQRSQHLLTCAEAWFSLPTPAVS